MKGKWGYCGTEAYASLYSESIPNMVSAPTMTLPICVPNLYIFCLTNNVNTSDLSQKYHLKKKIKSGSMPNCMEIFFTLTYLILPVSSCDGS